MDSLVDSSLEQQIISRAYRMGAKRRVEVEKLYSEGTIEEHIHISHQSSHDTEFLFSSSSSSSLPSSFPRSFSSSSFSSSPSSYSSFPPLPSPLSSSSSSSSSFPSNSQESLNSRLIKKICII